MKKYVGILITIVGLFTIYHGLNFLNDTSKRNPANLDISTKEKYLGYLPENYELGAREYLRMMGQEAYEKGSVWGANKGISNYNMALLEKNKCFADLAKRFYHAVGSVQYSPPKPRNGNITFALVDSTNMEYPLFNRRVLKCWRGRDVRPRACVREHRIFLILTEA